MVSGKADNPLAGKQAHPRETERRFDSQEAADRSHMAEALRLAARIPARPWPNPPVGAVVVKDGRVVGRGAHHGAGTPHAEVGALAEASERARGATLYCTLEPCNHTGRTPPCAPAVLASGVTRVVVGIRDPNPLVTGGGLHFLAEHGVAVTAGVRGREACELIWPFLVTAAFARPYLLLKTAVSADGRFTAGPSAPSETAGPRYLTGEAARRDVHRLRRWMDLVLVGEQTWVLDRPRLDARLLQGGGDCPAVDPVPAYVDSDLSYRAGGDHPSCFVFTARQAADSEAGATLQRSGNTVLACDSAGGHVDPLSILHEAHRHGVHTVMVEGGPTLAAAFLARGVVDRWIHYIAPIAAGRGVQWPPEFPVAPTGEAVTGSPPAMTAAADEAAGSDQPAAGEVAGVARLPITFHLTACDSVGRDVRLVYDRLSFQDTLAKLARYPARIGTEQENC